MEAAKVPKHLTTGMSCGWLILPHHPVRLTNDLPPMKPNRPIHRSIAQFSMKFCTRTSAVRSLAPCPRRTAKLLPLPSKSAPYSTNFGSYQPPTIPRRPPRRRATPASTTSAGSIIDPEAIAFRHALNTTRFALRSLNNFALGGSPASCSSQGAISLSRPHSRGRDPCPPRCASAEATTYRRHCCNPRNPRIQSFCRRKMRAAQESAAARLQAASPARQRAAVAAAVAARERLPRANARNAVRAICASRRSCASANHARARRWRYIRARKVFQAAASLARPRLLMVPAVGSVILPLS